MNARVLNSTEGKVATKNMLCFADADAEMKNSAESKRGDKVLNFSLFS